MFHPAPYLRGVELYNAGAFWEAHEAWEELWRAQPAGSDAHRFLQGLIQCAAACLKAQQGDRDACARLSARALAHLASVQPPPDGRYMGLDLARFLADFRDYAAADALDVERRPALVLQR